MTYPCEILRCFYVSIWTPCRHIHLHWNKWNNIVSIHLSNVFRRLTLTSQLSDKLQSWQTVGFDLEWSSCMSALPFGIYFDWGYMQNTWSCSAVSLTQSQVETVHPSTPRIAWRPASLVDRTLPWQCPLKHVPHQLRSCWFKMNHFNIDPHLPICSLNAIYAPCHQQQNSYWSAWFESYLSERWQTAFHGVWHQYPE